MAITDKYVSSAAGGGGDGSIGTPYTWVEMVTEINAGSAAGIRYNVFGITSRTTNSDTISGSGTAVSPVIIRGYASTITDGYQGRTGNYKTLVTTNMGGASYSTGLLTISGSYIQMESISVASARSGNGVAFSGTNAIVARSCLFTNSSTNALAVSIAISTSHLLTDCDILLTGASGGTAAVTVSTGSRIEGCHIKATSSSASGINAAANPSVTDSLIYQCGGVGILLSATSVNMIISGCTIVGCGSYGVSAPASLTHMIPLTNCLLTDNTTAAINCTTAAEAVVLRNCFLRNNGSGGTTHIINSGDWVTGNSWGTTTSGSSTSDYTDAAGGDYSLIAASPAVGAGSPYGRSIGCFQRASSGGSVVRMYPIGAV